MGSLHIEKAAFIAAGNLLEGNGWTEALVEAKVTTQGRAESILKRRILLARDMFMRYTNLLT